MKNEELNGETGPSIGTFPAHTLSKWRRSDMQMNRVSSHRTFAGGILCALAIACGGTGQVGDTEGASNGTVGQPLGVGPLDLPPAAAAYVKVNNKKQLWVFYCSANGNLRRRRTVDDVWQSWEQVDSGCDYQSTPTIGTWPGSKTDTVMVYFRSTSSKLYEVSYGSNGVASLRNISSSSGVGNIAGSPVVVGTTEAPAIGVAVRKAATNELVTVDWYSGSWHVHPVGGSSTVKTTAPVFAFFEFGGKHYLTVQTSSTHHGVYSRNSFADPYRIKKGPFWSPYGVASAISSDYGWDPYLVARSSDGDLIWMPIEDEGGWETLVDNLQLEGSPATPATTDRDNAKCVFFRAARSFAYVKKGEWNALTLVTAPTPFSGFAIPLNGTGSCDEHVLYRGENNSLFIMTGGSNWEPRIFGAFDMIKD